MSTFFLDFSLFGLSGISGCLLSARPPQYCCKYILLRRWDLSTYSSYEEITPEEAGPGPGAEAAARGLVSCFLSHFGELSNNELKNVLLVRLGWDGWPDSDLGGVAGEPAPLSSLSPLVSSPSSFLIL